MLVQLESITRAFGVVAIAGVLCCLTPGQPAVVVRAQGYESAAPPRTPGAGWAGAPAYGELFAPRAHRDAYQFFTNPHGLETLLAELVRDAASVLTPGGWTPRALLAFDAFGQSGEYDRTRLARVYGARRARVARGPRQEGGAVVESWTLVSPYPDPTLTRLEPGTLLIVLRLP